MLPCTIHQSAWRARYRAEGVQDSVDNNEMALGARHMLHRTLACHAAQGQGKTVRSMAPHSLLVQKAINHEQHLLSHT
jgi:hypothetical protein